MTMTVTEEMVVRFVDLPSPGQVGVATDPREYAFASTLRSRPGKWAIFTPSGIWNASAFANRIKTGRRKAFRPDEDGFFEACSRQGEILVRYCERDVVYPEG